MSNNHPLKRALLLLLIVSVLIFAVLGIVIVLARLKGWFEVQVLLTTIVLAVASLFGLACEASRTPRGANLLPLAGLILTAIGAAMHLVCIWVIPDFGLFWFTTASVSIFAVATVHICLLSIARMSPRYRWVFMVACQVIYGLALLLVAMLFGMIQSREMFRVVTALAIVDVALTFLIPLLHRVSKLDGSGVAMTSPLNDRNMAAIDDEIMQLKKRIAYLENLRSEINNREFEAT